jgi:hypothetical protein
MYFCACNICVLFCNVFIDLIAVSCKISTNVASSHFCSECYKFLLQLSSQLTLPFTCVFSAVLPVQ